MLGEESMGQIFSHLSYLVNNAKNIYTCQLPIKILATTLGTMVSVT